VTDKILATNLGFPRIGSHRELKAATESYWAGKSPAEELLKTAEDNVQRLEKLAALSNVPAVEYEKAKSEAARLRGVVETERIERDRNLGASEDATKKLEAQLKNSELFAFIETAITAI